MRQYQTLTLIGGIVGIGLVPIILLVISFGTVLISSFDRTSDLDPGMLGELTAYSLMTSIFVSIVAIVIVFTVKRTKIVGYVLLGLGVIMIVATNISGIIAWVLFIVGGITAIKYKILDSQGD